MLRRETVAEEIKALDQTARAQLRKYGVRFGAFNIYFPTLLKPASADLLLLLWALHSGREQGFDADTLPPRPQQGLTSVDAGKEHARGLLAYRGLPCRRLSRRPHRHARAPV